MINIISLFRIFLVLIVKSALLIKKKGVKNSKMTELLKLSQEIT